MYGHEIPTFHTFAELVTIHEQFAFYFYTILLQIYSVKLYYNMCNCYANDPYTDFSTK